MKKLFGGINLSWPKLIVMALLAAVYGAAVCIIPGLKETSFHNSSVSFEIWILFGIFIIMNSKSNIDSALKCFVFFLISQPLIYIIQDIINGSSLVSSYYGYWFIWTIACLPMGFIGYYLKKDKWWGLLILVPMMIILGFDSYQYFNQMLFSFPKHLLSYLFCVASLIIYPLYIFKNRINRIIGLVIGIIIIIVLLILSIGNKAVYETDVLCSGSEYSFDNTYKVYLKDNKYGTVSIIKLPFDSEDMYCVHGNFVKEGKTELVLESSLDKMFFDLNIKRNTYDISRKEIDY